MKKSRNLVLNDGIVSDSAKILLRKLTRRYHMQEPGF